MDILRARQMTKGNLRIFFMTWEMTEQIHTFSSKEWFDYAKSGQGQHCKSDSGVYLQGNLPISSDESWRCGNIEVPSCQNMVISWWRHKMETFSALLALCAGNSPVTGEFTQIGQWRGALIFYLVCAWMNDREAGDSRRHRAHYDVNDMFSQNSQQTLHGYIWWATLWQQTSLTIDGFVFLTKWIYPYD